MKESMKIITGNMVRDPRVERRIIEYNREKFLIGGMVIGGILIMLALMY